VASTPALALPQKSRPHAPMPLLASRKASGGRQMPNNGEAMALADLFEKGLGPVRTNDYRRGVGKAAISQE